MFVSMKFLDFRLTIQLIEKFSYQEIPKLTGKKLVGNLEPEFLTRRCYRLGEYLNQLVDLSNEIPLLAKDEKFLKFFGSYNPVNESDWIQCVKFQKFILRYNTIDVSVTETKNPVSVEIEEDAKNCEDTDWVCIICWEKKVCQQKEKKQKLFKKKGAMFLPCAHVSCCWSR
jgi:hypothetical protein